MVFWACVLIAVSTVTFVAGLFLVPVLIVRIPPDYFVSDRPPRLRFEQQHPGVRAAFLAAKNLLGGALLIGGFLMLFMPGPGTITFVVGLALMDIPGKRALERRLVSLPKVLWLMNRLRSRYGHPPLLAPPKRQFA